MHKTTKARRGTSNRREGAECSKTTANKRVAIRIKFDMTLLLTGFGDRCLTTLRRERPFPEEVIVEKPQLKQQPAEEEAPEGRGQEGAVMRSHEIEDVFEARLRITERMCANCSHEHHQMFRKLEKVTLVPSSSSAGTEITMHSYDLPD
jgi:hypothetical protein